MINTIGTSHGTGTLNPFTNSQKTKQATVWSSSFLDQIMQGSQDNALSQAGGAQKVETPNTDAYLEHLKSKYGRVIIEKVGRDPDSLKKAGGRMRGHDVIIAPNILQEMAGDPKTGMAYEKKIDYFFHTVIPQGNAICAAKGLVFEPCGVVVHEDGSVTYICGCSDSPERVAEVNRINQERDEKRVEQRKLYLEQAMAATKQRKALWEYAAKTAALEKTLSGASDPLKIWSIPVSPAQPEASLPAETTLFLLSLQ